MYYDSRTNKCLVLLNALICAVYCELIVQLPDNELAYELMKDSKNSTARSTQRDFRIYWNVPTAQCISKGITFDDLAEYGITANSDGKFRGDRISILYDPGFFPALLRNGTQKEFFYRNGGVPQEGNMKKHLDLIEKDIAEQIPDANFAGLGIIDFESWKPIFKQNYAAQQPYQDVSVEIEHKRHPFWIKSWVQKEAARRFEESGRKFVESTIVLIKKLRPKAKWGYYAYPYCYNMGENYKHADCPEATKVENDRLKWLWDESAVLYPSVYLSKWLTPAERIQLVGGRIREAKRVNSLVDIYPYTWFKYIDMKDTFITKDDFSNTMKEIYTSGISGAVIWGSSNDVNTKERCLNLRNFVKDVLGPVSSKYTKKTEKDLKYRTKSGNTTETIFNRYYYNVDYIYYDD